MALTIDLSGRVALVTGGARGVGRGIAQRLLDAGSTVVICGRSAPDSLPTSTDGIRSAEAFRVADVRDPEAVVELIDGIVADLGSIDIVVNNAGGTPVVPAADASATFSNKVVQLNLMSALHVATAAYHRMADQPDGGTIVNITSMSGLRPSPGSAAYGAAKAGLTNLTTSLAMEWAPTVRVNCVSAGMVRTEMFEDYYGGPGGAAAVSATVPMGRVAEPTEIGDAVVYLASPLAAFVTGANLVVNGGGERLAFNEVR
ncbi:MAG: SDR family oxidoreductase [Actinobacteria bacterium]|nr:SDR family oxidoreductase [Actinomycetota bacterium]